MVVLDEDGKPCRACNSLTDFQNAMFSPRKTFSSSSSTSTPTSFSSVNKVTPTMSTPENEVPVAFRNDPPDSFELGQSTWTFLHSVAAYYPVKPTQQQKDEMQVFLKTFSHFYPCKPCARDFEQYLGNRKPEVDSRTALSLWMCDAHNAVNTKLGKPTFDCKYWQARWRDGWDEFIKSQK